MVDHRRTPGRKAYVLPGWFLGAAAAACVLGLVALGWLTFLVDDDPEPAVATSTPTATVTPTPTQSPSPSESPTPSESPSPSKEPEPEVSRDDIAVSVLNATRTVGLASQVARRVEKAGWTVGSIANWTTGTAQTAVHFPRGRRAEARLLAKDLGIDAVLPATTGMRSDRLTVLLLGLP